MPYLLSTPPRHQGSTLSQYQPDMLVSRWIEWSEAVKMCLSISKAVMERRHLVKRRRHSYVGGNSTSLFLGCRRHNRTLAGADYCGRYCFFYNYILYQITLSHVYIYLICFSSNPGPPPTEVRLSIHRMTIVPWDTTTTTTYKRRPHPHHRPPHLLHEGIQRRPRSNLLHNSKLHLRRCLRQCRRQRPPPHRHRLVLHRGGRGRPPRHRDHSNHLRQRGKL